MKIATFNLCAENWETNFSAAEFDSPQTLVIVFCAASFFENPGPLQQLIEKFPNSKIIGCSTAGEILGETINDESISVAVLRFEKTSLELAFAPVLTTDQSFAAGEKIARFLDRPALRGMIVLSDGLVVNGSRLVAGINSILPPSVVVTGGLAGDKNRFQKTWVLKDGAPHSNFVCAVGFYGENIKIGHGSKGGWDIFGPERKITRSNGNRLFELDGKPALELYKNYLGDLAAHLPASALLFPLSIRADINDEENIVRSVLRIDEESQALIFAGDVPEGSLAQLMRANFDRLIHGAGEAALMTGRNSASRDEIFSLAISCGGRRLILRERAEEELEAVMDELPPKTHQIGFYSYGEISPYATGYCNLHNQTMTLTTISEN